MNIDEALLRWLVHGSVHVPVIGSTYCQFAWKLLSNVPPGS